MALLETASPLLRMITEARTDADLYTAMGDATVFLNFDFFALAHHSCNEPGPGVPIRIHNYPCSWVDIYDQNDLMNRDAVRRGCHVTTAGFLWSRLPQMVDVTEQDWRTLSLAQHHGLRDGFTVPANVPGEPLGSCTFAAGDSSAIVEANLPIAQLVGTFGFERARQLRSQSITKGVTSAPLTDRQRDCVVWIARGKSDWEISRILGVSEETVTRHVKTAREKYGVQKRTLLAVRALADGTLNFNDVLAH